ncbi:MAG: siphovirus ReqiPepy6 Gp37-like family protein [Planctomycetaceae bacterium]|jgi:hypothetical protein|nr:siphovirus ReqiPepy6 Gp37-like family protein [Planctomycetaceae bacterium]
MAEYEVPKVFYQSSINANTAVEVAYLKSLSWANKTNNNGSFELIIPIDKELTPFNPVLGGYIRLSPGDTIMKIEKKKKIFDSWGNYWYNLSGRTKQADDDTVRDAQNNDYFFRYVYNEVNAESYSKFSEGTARTTINKQDILESSTYEDSLGGFVDEDIDTVYEEYSYGTTLVGQPRVRVNEVDSAALVTVVIGDTAVQLRQKYPSTNPNDPNVWEVTPHPNAGMHCNDTITRKTHTLFTLDTAPQISAGTESGANGKMNRITYGGSWIKNDVTNDVIVEGPRYQWSCWDADYFMSSGNWYGSFRQFSVSGKAIIKVRTITVKTEQEYLEEMQAFLETIPNSYGYQPAKINKKTGDVDGGHKGYEFKLKSKGEAEKRYKVDFNLGDTISINDTRLDVVYTGVVSGAIETIDSNGYSVEIEIGTLGATLEQRVQKVI